jgi:hypothetical protein
MRGSLANLEITRGSPLRLALERQRPRMRGHWHGHQGQGHSTGQGTDLGSAHYVSCNLTGFVPALVLKQPHMTDAPFR